MHEPFMYLSVPLPYATQQQMCKIKNIKYVKYNYYLIIYYILDVTFVSATNKSPIKYLITVNKQDNVKKIKTELVNLIDEDKNPDLLVVAEVFNKHISKILVSKII